VIGIGGMAHSEEKSDRDDGDQSEHSLNGCKRELK
jgi:hypothetical protein